MSKEDFQWLANNPEITHVTAGICDLNGVIRGKRLPADKAVKILNGGFRMPLSGLYANIWGEELDDDDFTAGTGDADGICVYTGRGVLPVDWTGTPTAYIPVSLTTEDGKPFFGDPRNVLQNIVSKFTEKGLRPVVAAELEFYLYDLENGLPVPVKSPITGRPFEYSDLLSVDQLDQLDDFINDVYAACKAQGIEADTAVSENAASQFEVNLNHTDDPVRAADDTVLFKRIIKGVARKHGFGATFMPKPYGDKAGNSMHIHFSLIDSDDNNIFNDGTDAGSPILKHAIGGLLSRLNETTLIFAPNFNSYRRLRPNSLAPIAINWGYENRTGAIRVPGGDAVARRIEHRVGGADANPYLLLSAILGAAFEGIEKELDPGTPVEGWSYDQISERSALSTNWATSIDLFEQSEFSKTLFSEEFHNIYFSVKRQEYETFSKKVSEFEYDTYLERV